MIVAVERRDQLAKAISMVLQVRIWARCLQLVHASWTH